MIEPTVTVQVCSDSDDNHVLECAEEAMADFLITGNKKHFPAFHKKTRVITPRQFLELFV